MGAFGSRVIPFAPKDGQRLLKISNSRIISRLDIVAPSGRRYACAGLSVRSRFGCQWVMEAVEAWRVLR